MGSSNLFDPFGAAFFRKPDRASPFHAPGPKVSPGGAGRSGETALMALAVLAMLFAAASVKHETMTARSAIVAHLQR